MIEAHRDYPVPRDMTFDDAQALLSRMLAQGTGGELVNLLPQ